MTSLATGLMDLSFTEMGKAAGETGFIWGSVKSEVSFFLDSKVEFRDLS